MIVKSSVAPPHVQTRRVPTIPTLDAYVEVRNLPLCSVGVATRSNKLSLFRVKGDIAEEFFVEPAGVTASESDVVAPWDAFIALLGAMSIVVDSLQVSGGISYDFSYTGPTEEIPRWRSVVDASGQLLDKVMPLGVIAGINAHAYLASCYYNLLWNTEIPSSNDSFEFFVIRLSDGSWYKGLSPTGLVQRTGDIERAWFFPAAEKSDAIQVCEGQSGAVLHHTFLTVPKPYTDISL